LSVFRQGSDVEYSFQTAAPLSHAHPLGSGESSAAAAVWITEFILSYDGKPSYTVSIMECSGEQVVRENAVFRGSIEASSARVQYAERMEVARRSGSR
jgi:hypothetical protein